MTTRAVVQVLIGVVLGLALTSLAVWAGESRAKRLGDGFAAQVDLRPLDRAAVHRDGRLKSFDSYAREMLGFISGNKSVNDLPADFLYLDLMIRPERYENVDLIYIKNKPMRARIVEILTQRGDLPPERLDAILKTGLISEPLVRDRAVLAQMSEWRRDVIRTKKFVDRIESAVALRDPVVLAGRLRLVPPPGSDDRVPWFSMNDLFPGTGPDGRPAPPPTNVLDPVKRNAVRDAYVSLVDAWRQEDVQGVNTQVARLAAAVKDVNPVLYPSQERLGWEAIYFKHSHLTWTWIVYLLSVVFLLMGVIYRWDGARRIGLGAFGIAFGLHTVALLLRWYVSGRWPNSNMFEAVTTSVWLGTCLAIVIDRLVGRTVFRGVFLLTAGVASMAGMMAAHYVPQLDASIRNMMPILHDLWLYIHTNVIIASYALIAMASVTALLYLGHRLIGGPADYAKAGGAAMLIDEHARPDEAHGSRRARVGELLDGATMVLMELSCVLLWAGLVMGAIWADHSWGRPWGWDPKEVFALNTFLVFLILVHVRLKVADKGLWTAILAIIGCGVMLFNWTVINFIIAGLHSYA